MDNSVNTTSDETGTLANAYSGLDTQPVLDFFASIIDSLAWPIVILIIILIFRAHLISALKNLKSVKYGDAEATFERELAEATFTAQALETPEIETAKENTARINELIEMASTSPTGAIIEAWKDIEKAARDVVEKSGLPLASTPSRPYFNLQNFLSDHNLLPKAEIDTFRELRMIRNRAAHSNDFDISSDIARRYINLADRLIDAIKTSGIKQQFNIPDPT